MLVAALLACAGPDGVRVPKDAVDTAAPAAENVLLVVLDDVGIERLTTYGVGSVHAVTPRIDALAAEGVRFTTAWANPVCSPSRASLMTGRHGARTGFGTVNPPSDHWVLPEDEVTLPELLPEGWTDAAIGKWHLGDRLGDGLDHPLRSGFSSFSGSMNNLYESWGGLFGERDYYDWERNVDGVLGLVDRYATTQTTDEAVAFVTTTPAPWFLYLSYNAAHSPLDAPPPDLFGGPWDEAATDEQKQRWIVEAFDTELGRVLDALPERTHVLLVGDNGTPDFAPTGELTAETVKRSPFEGGVRVPLVVAGPLVGEPGVSEALVHVVDVFATVGELVGADLSALPRPIDGRSLAPFVRDPSLPGERDVLYTDFFGPNGPPPHVGGFRTVRDRRWKLVVDEASGAETLYDLEGRTFEGEDLLAGPLDAEQQAALERLRGTLATFRSDLAYDGPSSP